MSLLQLDQKSLLADDAFHSCQPVQPSSINEPKSSAASRQAGRALPFTIEDVWQIYKPALLACQYRDCGSPVRIGYGC